MKRSIGLALGLPLALLPLAIGACSSSNDSSSSTTTAAAVPSTAASTTRSTETTSKASPSSTAKVDACVAVTKAEVAAARPDLNPITTWTCAADADNRPWVGGVGEAGGGQADVNFILQTGADKAFVQYDMAQCTNPPVPQSLLQYCQAN